MFGRVCLHQISHRARSRICFLRAALCNLDCRCPRHLASNIPGPERFPDGPTALGSNAMTHAGSRESIVGEARQGWAMGDPALYPSESSILPVSKITSTTAQSLQAKTHSLQLDATDLPSPGFLRPLQGLSFPGEVRSLGVVPVPEGHQRTIPIGILLPWWQL